MSVFSNTVHTCVATYVCVILLGGVAINFSKGEYCVHKGDNMLEFVLHLNKSTCMGVSVKIVSNGE